MGLNDLLRCLNALAGTPGAVTKLTDSSGASQTASSLLKHKLYVLCGDNPFYVKMGATATTSDQYWPGNFPLYIFTESNTQISIIRATGTATNVTVTAWNYDPAGSPPSLVGDFGA